MSSSIKVDNNPLVSVIMLVYNHEKYLRQALEGVINQITNFQYEVIIHDDASCDRSKQIIQYYADRYPDRIIPIYQVENQYSKGVNILLDYMFPQAKGKYLAFCEGDDFWIDPNKLQFQVDYLESPNNSDCVATYHNCKLVDEDGRPSNSKSGIYSQLDDMDFSISRYATGEVYPGQLASLIMRASVFDLDDSTMRAFRGLRSPGGDSKILLLALCRGRVHVFNRIMSAHRVSYSNGSYTARTASRNMSGRSFVAQVDFRKFCSRYFGKSFPNYYKIFHSACAVVIKAVRFPCDENLNALKYAVDSIGGPISFAFIAVQNGILSMIGMLF